MSSDKFHCTNGHCLTDCALSSIDYDKDLPPGFCPHSGIAVCWKKCETTEKKPTVFDTITASPEVLAKFLVFHNRIYKGRTKYHSAVVGGEFDSYEDAIAATVAKLKEVCDA